MAHHSSQSERRWARLRLFELSFARPRTMANDRCFVYVLKNSEQLPRYYTGLTADPVQRLVEHNQANGQWSARSGSGGAFAKRHLR
jgi:hypothetical protein